MAITHEPKLLLFDIETKPNLAYVWGKYEQNVLSFKEERELLSFAFKWLGDKKVQVYAECDFKTNKELVKKLYDLFVEADIVCGHNGNKFDIRISNAFFAHYGFKPPPPHKTIDTLQVARHYFKFNSNKLDDLGEYLDCGRKVKTGGFDLWLGCMKGDKKSWTLMKQYNKMDVILLEKVYLKLRPWMQRHPIMNEWEQHSCPICSSIKTHKRGFEVTLNYQKQRFTCADCGKWFYGPKIKK